jgi:hypothetical protein
MLVVVLVLAAAAAAQKPVPELPRVYIDTTWRGPNGGTTWLAHTTAELSTALAKSAPGDVIVLDAGVTYIGNFTLQAKANPNNKWIYVVSSQLEKLPEGKRVSPADAENMPKIVTPNAAAALVIIPGTNHYRFAGVEITTASTAGACPTCTPPHNPFTYFLVGVTSGIPSPEPDSLTFDRCYIHGMPNIDVKQGLQATASNFAVVDSYISELHIIGGESQGVLSYISPGPIKIVNNYIESSTENIMFGGAGGYANPYITSDAEIRNNYLFKPLSWVVKSVTDRAMVVKNAFELKSAQRVLFDSNTIENVWANAGQNGYAIVLTIRSSQSGDISVVNDITVTNNVLKNVVRGFNTLGKDDACWAKGGYPDCHNPGSQDRWYIANNLIQFYDPTLLGGLPNLAFALGGGTDNINGHVPGVLRDVVIQHNTTISAASTPCWFAVLFGATTPPPWPRLTDNIWILDNVFCRQPSGDNSFQGTAGLTQYMGAFNAPSRDLDKRFTGNVMYVSAGNQVQTFPPHNLATTKPFRFVDPAKGNYDLFQPKWTETSDGKLAGVDSSALPQ